MQKPIELTDNLYWDLTEILKYQDQLDHYLRRLKAMLNKRL